MDTPTLGKRGFFTHIGREVVPVLVTFPHRNQENRMPHAVCYRNREGEGGIIQEGEGKES